MPFTFATIKTRVAEILEDASFAQWSQALVGQYVNDAARDFAMRTKCIRKYSGNLVVNSAFETLGTGTLQAAPNQNTIASLSDPSSFRVGSYIYSLSGGSVSADIPIGTTITSVNVGGSSLVMSASATAANTVTLTDKAFAYYTVPSDIHELESVWVNGYHVPQARVGRLPYQWDIETCASVSEPSAYLYGDFGLSVIRFWPFPNDAAFPTAKVYYTALPVEMLASETLTSIGIPDRYGVAIVYYTVAMCYRRNFEDADRRKSEEFMALYLDQVRDCQGRIERLLNAEGFGVPYRHL